MDPKKLTPETVAEAVERARYGLLRHSAWEDLRESERTTRIEVLRSAMDSSGVTEALEALRASGDESDALAERLFTSQRDAKDAQAAHDRTVLELNEEIASLREKLDEAELVRAEAVERAENLNRLIVTIRSTLEQAEQPDTAADKEPSVPSARSGGEAKSEPPTKRRRLTVGRW